MSFHPTMTYGAAFHRSSRQLEDEGEPFEYTPDNRARFDEIVARYPSDRRRSAVLPALYLVQAQRGYMTASAMRYVAELLGITRADVEDVVSYYTMFHVRQPGRYILSICRTLSCALNGAERVTAAICDRLGIEPGQTDPSGTFTVAEVECLGACDRAPVIMINDTWHERQDAETVARLLDDLRARGEAALTGCHHVIEARREGD